MDITQQKYAYDYAAIYRMRQTKGWKEIERLLKKDEVFFTKLLKTRKPSKLDTEGASKRGEFLTDSHDIGHARGVLEIVDKVLNTIDKADRLANSATIEEE